GRTGGAAPGPSARQRCAGSSPGLALPRLPLLILGFEHDLGPVEALCSAVGLASSELERHAPEPLFGAAEPFNQIDAPDIAVPVENVEVVLPLAGAAGDVGAAKGDGGHTGPLLLAASARAPTSVIRMRRTSMTRPPAITCSIFAVAKPRSP